MVSQVRPQERLGPGGAGCWYDRRHEVKTGAVMDIIRFADLPQGGFAGLTERRFVTDARVFGARKEPGATDGIGNFVYLADANFLPNGETGLHPHREIDVISIMVQGRISHAGSLEHGQSLESGTVQVQRAGAEGFTHNEINPDANLNQMIQLWVLPDESGEAAGYKVYRPPQASRTRVYGGAKDQDQTFYSNTCMDVVNIDAGDCVEQQGSAMAYLTLGDGDMNGVSIDARTLVRGTALKFVAATDAQLVLIYTAD